MDFVEKDGTNFLIIVDAHSKWLEACIMPSTTSARTIEALRSLFASYGVPEEIVSDHGPQLTSAEFRTLIRWNGVQHTLVPVYHSASNGPGAAERAVQSLKWMLLKNVLDRSKSIMTLAHQLANWLFRYRNTPHTTTHRTSAELFLNRQPRTRFSLLKPNL